MPASVSDEPMVPANRVCTTAWSLILTCGGTASGHESMQKALRQLCTIYWKPIYAFIRRKGHTVADAQDLTQDFFLVILSGNLLEKADPARGRFRCLLLKSLQHFLSDQATRA